MLGKRVVAQANLRGYSVFTNDGLRLGNSGKLPILPSDLDVIINCAGILPGGYCLNMVETNALGPWELAEVGIRDKTRLIHMSTDCVYSGRKSGWLDAAKDNPDPIDL